MLLQRTKAKGSYVNLSIWLWGNSSSSMKARACARVSYLRSLRGLYFYRITFAVRFS
jgi:hypothetical protein